ncbi:MAG: alpha/beta hydrolase [Chloroflexota bacterium]|nr:alpha/beta hydrolase [Chloroflexota bacterium]
MLRKGVIGLVGAAIGLEVYNRRVTLGEGRLEQQLPVQPTMWHWRFGKVAVYEAGDPQKPPLLLLHGHNAAASAAEMREPFSRLSEMYHIFAPDLLGYGLSDRPDVSYTPQLYVEFIEEILREVIQRPAIVVASSLTAAYAIEAAAANPEWITSLILICPTGVRSLANQSNVGKAIGWILGLPVLGQALYNGIASKASIAYFLRRQTYHDAALVSDEVVKRYYRTAHEPGARYAPAAFVSGRLYWDASDAWTRLEQPTLIVWGREAKLTPVTGAAAFLATNPAAELEEIDYAGILPHDEQPEQFATLVGRWNSRTQA